MSRLIFFEQFKKYIPYVIPIIGVLFFGWSTFAILLFFCVENALQALFFFLRGAVSVYYGGSTGFLVVFLLLYGAHVLGTTHMVVLVSQYLSILSIPSSSIIIANIVPLLIPHVVELVQFTVSMHAIGSLSASQTEENIKKGQDITPIISFILSIQEMFFRIFALWISLFFAFIFVFVHIYVQFSPFVSNIFLIIVFSCIHFFFDKQAYTQREKAMQSYRQWKGGM